MLPRLPLQIRSPDRFAFNKKPAVPGTRPAAWRKMVRAELKPRIRAGTSSVSSVLREEDLTTAVRNRVRAPMNVPVPESWVTWRYLPGPRIRAKHALNVSESTFTGHVSTSRCGIYSYDGVSWLGTGRQGEYEKLDRLPRCKSCEKTLELQPPADTVSDGTDRQGWMSPGQDRRRRRKEE